MFQTFESLIRTLRTLVPDFTPAQNPDRPKFAMKTCANPWLSPSPHLNPTPESFGTGSVAAFSFTIVGSSSVSEQFLFQQFPV